MWGEIFTGLAGLITTVGGLWLAFRRQQDAALQECELAQRMLRVKATRHIGQLERSMSIAGLWVPDRPDELY